MNFQRMEFPSCFEELKDEPSVMGLILGTGFGGGLVYQGQVFSGRNHVAGEFGHMRLPLDAWLHLGDNAPMLGCGCGKNGCLDCYLSGRGFELLYEHYYGEQKKAISYCCLCLRARCLAKSGNPIDQLLPGLCKC